MSSFNDAIAQLVIMLETNPGLVDFAQQSWNKTMTVKPVFKNREEVSLSDLPIVMITRPRLDPSFEENTVYGGHAVSLYYGFQQNNKELSQAQIITFEERITDALLSDPYLKDTALDVVPGLSVNDEGKFHPVYFGVMAVSISHKR